MLGLAIAQLILQGLSAVLSVAIGRVLGWRAGMALFLATSGMFARRLTAAWLAFGTPPGWVSWADRVVIPVGISAALAVGLVELLVAARRLAARVDWLEQDADAGSRRRGAG